jgi:hypothetical protein
MAGQVKPACVELNLASEFLLGVTVRHRRLVSFPTYLASSVPSQTRRMGSGPKCWQNTDQFLNSKLGMYPVQEMPALIDYQRFMFIHSCLLSGMGPVAVKNMPDAVFPLGALGICWFPSSSAAGKS